MDCNGSASIGHDEYCALVDGALDGAKWAAAAAAIYSDPVASRLVTDWRRQTADLGLLHAEILDEPIPARMQMLVNGFAREWRQAS